MGGTNQATAPAPSGTAKPAVSQSQRTSYNPVRFHENQGEVHFHDDKAGLKCAIETAAFFGEYHKWRPAMTGNLALVGHDGKGGHSKVEFLPYLDDDGKMQVTIAVDAASMGQTVLDLDKLAGFS